MIIPSIYIYNQKAIEVSDDAKVKQSASESESFVSDPEELARTLSLVGEITIFDMNKAEDVNVTTNEAVIKRIINVAECRVGGGIDSLEAALDWLDIGVTKVVVDAGTAQCIAILQELPSDRVVLEVSIIANPDSAGGTYPHTLFNTHTHTYTHACSSLVDKYR